MSLHTSVIAIRGNYLRAVPTIFERCDYRLLGSPTIYSSTADAWRDLERTPDGHMKVKKLAYCDGGWTFIVDNELTMLSQDDVWLEVSQEWRTRVFGWICEGASGTYAMSVFDHGKAIRVVYYGDGELLEDQGSQLPEEAGVD